ncbi:MAG: TonB-dependent receptor [Burkholderiales bacterium]
MHRAHALRRTRGTVRRLVAAGALATCTGAANAQAIADAGSLADLSLEQLTNIVVTSVSRRAQSLADAPASVYVITHDEIHRSGVTSLPEALRLAPNLQVARADTNQYAITARGFNNVLANKLLVMIDGRTVYSPLFSGTFWEAQDVLLEDIDRIEVISGPGATLWGANAVNGVINILTRDADQTQGTLLAAGGGNTEYGGVARYGGKGGNGVAWRAYAKSVRRDNSEFANGTPITDASTHTQAGFRIDHDDATQERTLQGDAYTSDIDQVPSSRTVRGANLLARWSARLRDGALARVQAYYDYTYRDHPGTFRESLSTFDLEAQYGTRVAAIHEIVAGAGYRVARDRVTNSRQQAFLPADRTLAWANLFAQDQVALATDVDLVVGAKLETNVYTDVEFLPNVRLAWRPAPNHIVWAAASRAVRSPARIDRDLYLPGVPPYVIAGNETFDAEIANVYELGYRAQLASTFSLTVTIFTTDYDRLRSLHPQAGGAVWANDIEGTNTGVEAWASWRVLPAWLLTGGITGLRERWKVKPGAVDIGGFGQLGNDPAMQWNARSSWDITPTLALDVMARGVSALPAPAVPAYTAVDARLAWRPTRSFEVSLTGQNLCDPRHAEWGAAPNRAEFGRAFFLAFQWTPQ